jgi:hypothetical protein
MAGGEGLEAFERECKATARNLRRMPADLRKALSAQVQPRVAVPLAGKVANSFAGPWAAPLAASTKARKLADPTIVIGGSRPVVRGGASARQLVYGATWGGGKRVASVTRRTRAGSTTYRAHVTKQFQGKSRDNLIPTLRASGGWVLEEFAAIVEEVWEAQSG